MCTNEYQYEPVLDTLCTCMYRYVRYRTIRGTVTGYSYLVLRSLYLYLYGRYKLVQVSTIRIRYLDDIT